MADAAIAIQRPLALKAVNRLGALAARCGIAPFSLDAEQVLARAEQTSGFRVQDRMVREGLGRLVEALDSQARLSLFGRLATRNLVQRMADSRFRVERALANRPELAEDAIRTPVFIIGMPRSGTTILHALLHLDRNHRAPLCWECLLPHPAPTPADYNGNDRIDTVSREFDQIFRLVPDFRKKHYMAADSPQECVGVTALNFASFQFLVLAWMPDYRDWFDNADQERNLRWHRRFLQFLQSGGARRPRWLLKSPVHLMRLKALFAVYPDARIIMTHRHPARIVPSVASLVSSMRSLYSDHEDTARTGEEQFRLWADYYARFLHDRREVDREAQIVDVLFEDFAANQMAVVDAIYQRFGWTLHAEDRTRMEQFLCEERQGKHGRHEYSLEEINIDSGAINREYGHYLDFLETLK